MIEVSPTPLSGKKGLVLGIANEHSIAYGCAKGFRALGADLAITYLNEKAKRFVEPLANELGAPIFLPCDVSEPGSSKLCLKRWIVPGGGLISRCTPSPLRRRTICTAG